MFLAQQRCWDKGRQEKVRESMCSIVERNEDDVATLRAHAEYQPLPHPRC